MFGWNPFRYDLTELSSYSIPEIKQLCGRVLRTNSHRPFTIIEKEEPQVKGSPLVSPSVVPKETEKSANSFYKYKGRKVYKSKVRFSRLHISRLRHLIFEDDIDLDWRILQLFVGGTDLTVNPEHCQLFKFEINGGIFDLRSLVHFRSQMMILLSRLLTRLYKSWEEHQGKIIYRQCVVDFETNPIRLIVFATVTQMYIIEFRLLDGRVIPFS